MRKQDQPGGATCATRSESGQFAEGNDGGGQGFAESTAEATGQSKASTNRATRRAREVCQQARDIIRNTKADTGVFLDQLAKMDDDQQVAAGGALTAATGDLGGDAEAGE